MGFAANLSRAYDFLIRLLFRVRFRYDLFISY